MCLWAIYICSHNRKRAFVHWWVSMHTATKIPFLFIPRKGLARPRSQFFHIHVSVSDLYMVLWSQVFVHWWVPMHTATKVPFIYSQKRNCAAASVSIYSTFMCACERFIYVPTIAIHWWAHAHCDENPIYLFPEKKLRRGLSPNFFHIYVCLWAVYVYSQDRSKYFPAAEWADRNYTGWQRYFRTDFKASLMH